MILCKLAAVIQGRGMVTMALNCFPGAGTTWAGLMITSVASIFGTNVSRISAETAELRVPFHFSCYDDIISRIYIYTLELYVSMILFPYPR